MHADALRVLAERPHEWPGWKLVANLPYSVASPVLVELATAEHPPERLVATLQLEVVRRLMAGPGGKDYGVLTLLVQLRYEPRGSFKIPADCFFPAPDVDSGCITLVRRSEDALDAAGRRIFARVVKRAFSERRKKALKLLKFDWPAAVLETAWAELGLDVMARAENLGREHFVALTRRLFQAGAAPSGPALESRDPPP
jgi:16S rRNA (adenine1518-N6/adenine1519-N6)-dimethyltransferase